MNSLALNTTDYLVIAGYFAFIFVVVGFTIFKKGKQKPADGASNYFLGGRNLGWFVVGASLFASNIGSEHLVGLSGAGASGDFAAAQIEILAAFMLLLLGWLFVPFYLRSKVFTMPEFLELRYDTWSRKYLSWVSILAYILTKISITIVAGGLVLTTFLPVDFWSASLIIVAVTGLYTIIGGFKAVVYTDLIQLFVLLGGAIALTIFGLDKAGGWETVVEKTEPAYLSLWRSVNDANFPWTGILFGAPILGVWYWCTDQFIVQRVLAARNLKEARKGAIFAGFLKLSPLFIFVIPGVIAYSMTLGENPAFQFPIIDGKVAHDAALPMLSMAVLPVGFRGLLIAGLIAALMSSLSSVFNSCSTLFTMDIYRRLKPDVQDVQLVWIGRVATVIIILLSLAWIPVLQSLQGGLFQKLQSLQAYIAPPIAAVFLLGVTSKRVDAKGAKYALIVGSVLGLLRLILEAASISLPTFLRWFTEMNFLHFAIFLFTVCVSVLYFVSRGKSASVEGAFNTELVSGAEALSGSRLNKVLSVILVLAILILWYVFA